MSVTVVPLWNYVLLELEPEPAPSSIIAVQKATVGLTRFGVVTAIGDEVRDIKVGMRVLASVTAGNEIPNVGMLIAEGSVIAITHQ